MRSTLPHFKADLFKALAHPPRIRILELLRGGERTVTDLQAALGVKRLRFRSNWRSCARATFSPPGKRARPSIT